MINKRTFLIAFAVCSAYFLQAQEVSKTAISTPKNEFSIGIGYYTNHKSFDDMPSMELDRSSPLYEYNSGKYTLSEIRQTLSVDMAYHYHLSKHWALGAQAAWQHTYRYRYDIISNNRNGSFHMHNITLLASCRYYYSIAPIEQFYSGIAIGATDRMYKGFYNTGFSHKINPIVHATLLGAMVGKRLYGYAEFGVGALGVLRCGAGYRF